MSTNWGAQNFDFDGLTDTFPARLAEQLALLKANIEAVLADVDLNALIFEGTGAEGDVSVLAVGSSLSVNILNLHFRIAGRRYDVNGGGGWVPVTIPANGAPWHVYLGADLTPQCFAARQETNPAGTWYVGTVTTDGTHCTAVDDTNADRIVPAATISAMVVALSAAVGLPYTSEATLDARVTSMESGAIGGQPEVFWNGLRRSLNEAGGIAPYADQAAEDAVAAHVLEYHGGGVTGTVPDPWDGLAKLALHAALRETTAVDRKLPTKLGGMLYVAGIWGDGHDSSPDYRYSTN